MVPVGRGRSRNFGIVSSSVVSAEVLTYVLSKSGKSEFILKKEQKLAIFCLFSGEMFLYGYGKSICFQALPFIFDRWHTRLGSISKKKTDLVSYTFM